MTLRDILMIHVDEGTLTALAAQFILDEHDRRTAELLEANNRYLQEARDARARANKAEAALAVLDVAFCVRHGSFPVDRSTRKGRFLHDSMRIARRVTGDSYNDRVALAEATLAAYRAEQTDV